MTETTKNHEQDLQILALQLDMTYVKDTVGKIDKKLDGVVDLNTRVTVNEKSIGRIWYWLGGISMAILGFAFFCIQTGLAKAMGM